MLKVLIADDHPIVRQGLKQILSEEPDMEVLGEAQNSHEVLNLVQKQNWDVVILDISMPGRGGLDVLKELKQQCPKLPVLILSMHPEDRFATRSLMAGASGYLLKDCEFDELVNAVRLVIAGKTYISPSISDTVVENYVRNFPEKKDTAFSILTKREREVLQLLTEGKTTKQIGKRLHISAKTVEVHRLNIMGKLKIDNIAQLTKYAIQEGLTLPEP